jgi:hypothetical protein
MARNTRGLSTVSAVRRPHDLERSNTMRYTALSLFVLCLAVAGCSSLADVSGPYARSTSDATRTDAGTDRVERSPFPQATDQGLF